MKKLMIAAAIVCAAAMVQAASIDWGVAASSWYDRGNVKGGSGVTAYLVDAKQMDAIIAAIDTTTGALNTQDASWYFGQQTTGSKGKVLDGDNNPIPMTSANLVRNNPYDFATLIIDASDAANGNIYYLLSDSSSQIAYLSGTDEATAVSFTSDHFGENALSYDGTNAQGWAAVSVPEPTSGLLLLLGVAGLALRRRRA